MRRLIRRATAIGFDLVLHIQVVAIGGDIGRCRWLLGRWRELLSSNRCEYLGLRLRHLFELSGVLGLHLHQLDLQCELILMHLMDRALQQADLTAETV